MLAVGRGGLGGGRHRVSIIAAWRRNGPRKHRRPRPCGYGCRAVATAAPSYRSAGQTGLCPYADLAGARQQESEHVTIAKSNSSGEATRVFSRRSGQAVTRQEAKVPLLAIVGRPNVGKSTLFNRLVGSRRAIVGNEPGITRDRLYGDSEWRGRTFRVVDTGGIVPDDKDFIPAEILRQARVALHEAAAIVMVVDGRTELAAPDLELARLLRITGKPLYIAVNKVDSDKQVGLEGDFHRLGVNELFPISAEHGRGIDDLLDAFVATLPPAEGNPRQLTTEDTEDTKETTMVDEMARDHASVEELPTEEWPAPTAPSTTEVKVAIIGHPNVGKSTLLNQLTGTSRAIVSPIPGTTRDAVDEIVTHDGKSFRFIDTAGI